ncbi:hypothetical protein Y032_0008g186 [Ancylostoma ceylanicum]|uniref:Uncharacterized protein n=1 Tax=Ancylostoma ceylanicum TaxID=53326 RepID=A0A016VL86_9BILA|nr:hypothetical protein Y032_0008g186 [Ancylostoma ceylanicum]
MNTPRRAMKFKDRQKRPRIELQESPSSATEFDLAAEHLINNEDLPLNLRTVIGYLMEKVKQLDVVLDKNRELVVESQHIANEVISLRSENKSLNIALGQENVRLPSTVGLF